MVLDQLLSSIFFLFVHHRLKTCWKRMHGVIPKIWGILKRKLTMQKLSLLRGGSREYGLMGVIQYSNISSKKEESYIVSAKIDMAGQDIRYI